MFKVSLNLFLEDIILQLQEVPDLSLDEFLYD